jgi:hypothetical protein
MCCSTLADFRFNFFDLECPGETRTLWCAVCNRFVSGSRFLLDKVAQSCICCAVAIASAFLFPARGCHTPLPLQHIAWGSLLQILWTDCVAGLVSNDDRIKEHRVWTRLIVPCSDALG